jgi:hypothetical protein
MKTSSQRYHYRISKFVASGAKYPKLAHHFFWLLHNCVSHPILAFWLNQKSIEFHQLTSNWLNCRSGNQNLSYIIYPMMDVEQRKWWTIHNIISHFGIGILPCNLAFRFHDWTAEKMNVKGWV